MRSSILVISMLVVLSGCTLPGTTNTTTPTVEYSTTQSGSPAAKYCTQHGGQVSIEKNPTIPTMDLIYCTLPGREKIDAWKYMDMQTSQTGAAL